jgi:hypothetical protein
VRTVLVVLSGVLSQHRPQVPPAEDQHVVEALAPKAARQVEECRLPAGAQHARAVDAAHHSGRHITPRQAGFAFEEEAVRALVSLPTRADGYARSAAANVRA